MEYHELEHIIRACCDITGQYELVIIGSHPQEGQPAEILQLMAELGMQNAVEIGK